MDKPLARMRMLRTSGNGSGLAIADGQMVITQVSERQSPLFQQGTQVTGSSQQLDGGRTSLPYEDKKSRDFSNTSVPEIRPGKQIHKLSKVEYTTLDSATAVF